jgi:class 3 adenylate cyclase
VVDDLPLERPRPQLRTLTLLVGRITTIKLAYWSALTVAEIALATRVLAVGDPFAASVAFAVLTTLAACAWAAWSARASDQRLGGLERSIPTVATTFLAASVVATPASLPLLFVEIQRAGDGCVSGICHWQAVWYWVAAMAVGTVLIPAVFALRMRRADVSPPGLAEMEGAMAMPRWRIGVGAWSFAVAAAIAVPLGVLAYVLASPLAGIRLDDAVQHFTVTSNVSLLAAAVSLGVLRSALDREHWPSALVGLGFLSLGGLFLAHGLTTPGVLLRGGSRELAAGSVVAFSGQLAMSVPAVLFAIRYTPVRAALERSRVVTPFRLLVAVAVAIVVYDVAALAQPVWIAHMADTMAGYDIANAYSGYNGSAFQADPAYALSVGGATVLLLAFSAYRQSAEFGRSRLPTHAALVLAFLFQAEAQVAALLSPTFSLGFWEYHALLGSATVLAVGAIFLELDRRRGLERFLPPTVVERVVTGDQMSLMGQRRTATILFTDLRGSTALAERATPEAAVATVNAYLRAMARAVIDEGGILDKFTGDGLMAIFGAMGDAKSGAAAAARAALRMRADLAAVNAERSARGEPTVGYGVGINTGDVVLGAVGLPERSDYTAMGDTVNTAARMESLTKDLGTDVVVSEATAAQLDGTVTLRPLGTASVKGKSAPVAVFAIS